MKHIPNRMALTLIAALIAPAAFAADADPIATVNGTPIPAARAKILIDQNAQSPQMSPEDKVKAKEAIRENLIQSEVITQSAVKNKLDKTPEIQAQLDLARQSVLIRAYIDNFMKVNKVSDADIQTEYDKIKVNMSGKEYKARHILLATEEEAKDIIAQLKKGAKFEELAKKSQDPGSREQGGDLGWGAPARYVKPFADALSSLEKGKYTTEPVKSDFGYHVIEVEDSRDMQPPPLNDIKPRLEQLVLQQQFEKHVTELEKQAKIK